MISQSDIQVILECAQKYSLTSVILFGSSLTESGARDIDLGIKGIEPKYFFDFYGEVFSRVSKPVDIINLDKKSSFNRLVEREGQQIYGKSI